MNVLTLQDVSQSYGTRRLFEDANMTFTDNKRIGLIGVNGTGKSTFMRMLAGLIEPEKGTILRNGKASVYYLPQAPEFDEDASLLENIFLADHPVLKLVREYERMDQQKPGSSEHLKLLSRMDTEGGWQVEQQARTILTKLGFVDLMRPAKELSGGQRRRLALGQALLYPSDLLLLDEPTNHLDEASIEWLEKYLLGRKGGLVISTHDRYFLDALSDEILELSDRHFYSYEGTYETFLTLKADREEREAATAVKRHQFLKRELAWVRRGAQARSTKQKARLQRYETLKAQDVARRADTLDPIALKSRLGKTIFDIEHLTFSRGDIPIVKDFTYHVVRHDRIGIVGPNGIGKSTFMGLLDGKFEPDAGTLGRGETVRIAHFTQELPVFDEDQRVLDYIREDHRYMVLADGSTLSAGQILERFLFTPELHGVPIRKLSGGEKRRLYLLKLLMSAPNVLLLDEPTNDLDIPTLEVLEDFLDSFSGIVITVCHDRYFLDRVVDKLFVFKGNGQIEIVHGAYSEYRDMLDEMEADSGIGVLAGGKLNSGVVEQQTGAAQTIVGDAKNELKSDKIASKGALASDETNDTSIAAKTAPTASKPLTKAEQAELAQLELDISELEGLLKAYDAMLNQAGGDYEAMEKTMAERADAAAKLDAKTERWLMLAER
ncbi:ABC-F family ATP-binding cassette domain-containing protein [Veillonella ratti]|uniref:ABC-F family ATP-binding cassette domain-containing protein n=1 Tax=Veillonella ratti TaxID=103892 RepID=UPI000F8E80D1|nr:ABC-F family ATP-binding cassette domain-containing protein [Veillonella ratti]